MANGHLQNSSGRQQPILQVVIVDADEAARGRLTRALQPFPGITIVGETGLVGEGIHLVRTLQPHLIVLDPSIPDWNSLTVVRALKLWSPASMILVATTSNSNSADMATTFLGAGATFYFDKHRDFQTATEVIATLHDTLDP